MDWLSYYLFMPLGPTLPQPVEAVVFDFDGTLIDSEACWAYAKQRFVETTGYLWDPQISTLTIGQPLSAVAALIQRTIGLRRPTEFIITDLRAFFRDRCTELGESLLLPDGFRMAQKLHGKLPLGIATTSPRVLLDVALACTGIAGLFEVILADQEVAARKPAPDVYLEACRRLDCLPARALAVEDSSTGLRSALAAGLPTIVRPAPGLPLAEDLLGKPLLTVTSLDEVPFAKYGPPE
jgi:beta-phosphoglucomutase-like phosphatase (HAD superfamily)